MRNYELSPMARETLAPFPLRTCLGCRKPFYMQKRRCEACLEQQRTRERANRRNPERIAAAKLARAAYEKRARVQIAAADKRRYDAHKTSDTCLKCRLPALDDHCMCKRHRDLHRANGRATWHRRRARAVVWLLVWLPLATRWMSGQRGVAVIVP